MGEEDPMDHDDAMGMLKAITTAFDEHDLDGIMAHFSDDAVFESPRGSEPWGTRVVGAAAMREAFAGRFSGIPDVRYQGDRTSSTVTAARPNGRCRDHDRGQRIEVRGCDLWTFRDGKVVKKDSFWKIRTPG